MSVWKAVDKTMSPHEDLVFHQMFQVENIFKLVLVKGNFDLIPK